MLVLRLSLLLIPNRLLGVKCHFSAPKSDANPKLKYGTQIQTKYSKKYEKYGNEIMNVIQDLLLIFRCFTFGMLWKTVYIKTKLQS